MAEVHRHDDFGWFVRRIEKYDERPFLTQKGRTYTFFELGQKISAYQGLLEKKGLPKASIVGLRADFQFESIAGLISLLLHQAIVAPAATSLSDDQVAARWETCNASWVWRIGENEEQLSHISNAGAISPLIANLVEMKAAGLVLFSSGSVGEPKAMVQNANSIVDSFRHRKQRKLRLISFLLFDHIGGINTLVNSLASGMHLIVPDARTPEVVAELIESQKVNLLPTSPTFLNLMLMSGVVEKYDLSSLKFVTYGTEPMPIGLLQRLKTAFPRCRFLQTFGTSETGIAKTRSRSSSSNWLKFEDENLEHKIVNGELWLRSRTQIEGYLNHDSQRFTDDGWFKTGDQVETAEDGYFRVVGRREEMINVGGEKVAPSEVEGVLMQLDGVLDCLVYGEANAITGSVVAADVVVESGLEFSKLRRQARRFCRSKLEPYKVPAKIRSVSHTEFSERYKKRRHNDAGKL